MDGTLTTEKRAKAGTAGFGFDPIFKPLTASKTFAEMTRNEKNAYSHRGKAIRKFVEWYLANRVKK